MFLEWLIVWFFVMAILEYAIHRWAMHKIVPWLPDWIFSEHAVEHHAKKRNDINIDLPLHNHIIVGSPLLLWAFSISDECFVALMCIFMFHSYTWTKIHRGIHGLETNWIMKTNFYKLAKHHHELHHNRPSKNFGVVFLFTDNFFRTKIK